jgi:hypothetical protein
MLEPEKHLKGFTAVCGTLEQPCHHTWDRILVDMVETFRPRPRSRSVMWLLQP